MPLPQTAEAQAWSVGGKLEAVLPSLLEQQVLGRKGHVAASWRWGGVREELDLVLQTVGSPWKVWDRTLTQLVRSHSSSGGKVAWGPEAASSAVVIYLSTWDVSKPTQGLYTQAVLENKSTLLTESSKQVLTIHQGRWHLPCRLSTPSQIIVPCALKSMDHPDLQRYTPSSSVAYSFCFIFIPGTLSRVYTQAFSAPIIALLPSNALPAGSLRFFFGTQSSRRFRDNHLMSPGTPKKMQFVIKYSLLVTRLS